MEIREGFGFVYSRSMATVCLAVLVAGCSNPKNTTIPTNIDSLDSISASVKKLTPQEQELFAGYFMRHVIGAKMGGMFGIKATPIPEGMTIGKAIMSSEPISQTTPQRALMKRHSRRRC